MRKILENTDINNITIQVKDSNGYIIPTENIENIVINF